jgi:parallel beta-helix repeat protein
MITLSNDTKSVYLFNIQSKNVHITNLTLTGGNNSSIGIYINKNQSQIEFITFSELYMGIHLNSNSHTEIQNNIFSNNQAKGIISLLPKTKNNIIRNNVFSNILLAGISPFNIESYIIDHNHFINNQDF